MPCGSSIFWRRLRGKTFKLRKSNLSRTAGGGAIAGNAQTGGLLPGCGIV